ncbi:hypothetical protein KEJ27_05760 [Candidatus Bathyarchaeota archaeon]|nr:hypothetical protein [Candidatus Bathyarchaeota archaeon]MBS7618296.1 hypothetical protein [Candidatus Bathyarchaeota archaeon]
MDKHHEDRIVKPGGGKLKIKLKLQLHSDASRVQVLPSKRNDYRCVGDKWESFPMMDMDIGQTLSIFRVALEDLVIYVF